MRDNRAIRAVEPKPETLGDKPSLNELDATKLENAVLRMEMLQLHFQQRQAELNTLVKGLERPGWLLQRTAGGEWIYQPAPPLKDDAL